MVIWWHNQILSSRNLEIWDARQPLLPLDLEVIKSQSQADVLDCEHREAKAAQLVREKEGGGAERKVTVRPGGPGDRLSDFSS